jgi:hypothetical protein
MGERATRIINVRRCEHIIIQGGGEREALHKATIGDDNVIILSRMFRQY